MSSALSVVDEHIEAPASDDLVSLEERAAALVNPESGLANDYLNIFNEVFLLIENLPLLLPEMLDELLAWRPKTYREYFETSPLPGAAATLKIYDTLDPDFRREFEQIVEGVTALSLACVKLIELNRDANGEIDPDKVSEFCQSAAITMRSALTRAADLVNHGHKPFTETPQETAERILASGSHHVEAAADQEFIAEEQMAAFSGALHDETAPLHPSDHGSLSHETTAYELPQVVEEPQPAVVATEPSPQIAQFAEIEAATVEEAPACDLAPITDVAPVVDAQTSVASPVAELIETVAQAFAEKPAGLEAPPRAEPAGPQESIASAPAKAPQASFEAERQQQSTAASGAQKAAPEVQEENFFTVLIGGDTLGLPVLLAQTIFQIPTITPIPKAPACILGLVNLRGRIVTAVSLRQRLQLPDLPPEKSLAICIEYKGETFALVVDGVGDVLTLSTSMRVPVPAHFDKTRSRFMSDLYKVKGQLVPVLNIATLFEFGASA